MIKFNKQELKEKFSSVKKAFKSFNNIETQGRKYIQKAIIGCYDIYLHYNVNLIQKRCDKLGITYKYNKPMKMILMIALKVSDDCDDERIKARIRTYVRILKHFDSLHYDIKKAQEELDKYGIDYCANPRSKNYEYEEGNDDNENQMEFDFGNEAPEENNDIDEDDETDDIDENAEENYEDYSSSTSNPVKTSLSTKIVNFLRNNKINDEEYVILVANGEVYKCSDTVLFGKLVNFDFQKLE